ncbi:uncharacterized protein LOC131929741 [Physella acuta]|uniref:uncharacterized protein LOC131929741 n=1 Tax=Physella acuta TaxID=109671 RepID=UPI0027DCBB59|nr:uncharacterized protein LOC131929741 [Physella acuta]
MRTSPFGDYFQATCQLTINVTKLSNGNNDFYPRISVYNQPSVSNVPTTIQIRSPTARLGSGCSDLISGLTGYIVKGGEASCTCEITDPGYPPGNVQWFTERLTPVGDVDKVKGTATLTIDFSKEDTEPKYLCKIFTVRENFTAQNLILQKYAPPTLLSSTSDLEKFTVSENGNVYIIIHIYSNPRPFTFSLTVEKKSANFTVAQQKYTTLVTFKSIWQGQVNLAILDIGPDDMGTYTMTVGNGQYPDMVYRFILEEETDYTPIAIGVGVSVGVLLIVAVVVAVVCYLKRRSVGRAPRASTPAKPNGNYSSTTPKQTDEHQYETLTSPNTTHIQIQSAATPPKQKPEVNQKDQTLVKTLHTKAKDNVQKPTTSVVEVAEYANSKSIAAADGVEEIYEN